MSLLEPPGVTFQLAESQLAECLYVGVRNRVRARDRFRDGVRDRMLGFGELGLNRAEQGTH